MYILDIIRYTARYIIITYIVSLDLLYLLLLIKIFKRSF